MIKNEEINGIQGQPIQSSPRSVEFSSELRQQITVLNARIGNANFAYGDLLREIENTIKVLLSENAALKKENANLKAKAEKANEP